MLQIEHQLTLTSDGEIDLSVLPTQSEITEAHLINTEVSQRMHELMDTIQDMEHQIGGNPLFVPIRPRLGSTTRALIYTIPAIETPTDREESNYKSGDIAFLMLTDSGFWAIRFHEDNITQEYIECLLDADWATDLDGIGNPTNLSNFAIALRDESHKKDSWIRISNQATTQGDTPKIELINLEFKIPIINKAVTMVFQQITCAPGKKSEYRIDGVDDKNAQFVLNRFQDFSGRYNERTQRRKSTLNLVSESFNTLGGKSKRE